jgi:hypothetical protein
MKLIINIGFNHAATTSLKNALNILGFSAIHDGFQENMEYSEHQTLEEQTELFYENFDNNKNIFDGFIPKYNAFIAEPSINPHFLRRLVIQYPEAYYIYTKRNHKDRYKSQLFSTLTFQAAGSPINNWDEAWSNHKKYIYKHIERGKKNELYIESVLKENINLKVLEFNVCDKGHGWKELCGFLNKEIPKVNFPHLNKNIHRKDNK